MHLRRTGSNDYPVQAELFDIIHNQFLPRTGTHKLVFSGYGNVGKVFNKLHYFRDVYHASDVRTAVTNIHTYFRLHAFTSLKMEKKEIITTVKYPVLINLYKYIK
jgi:hypothetical protein